MSQIDSYYRSAIVYTQSPPQTETVSSNFNYSKVENQYGSDILLYTGLIPSTNPLTAAADGDKYAVDGTDIIEKVAVQELTAVQESAFGFTDSRLTYLIPPGSQYTITAWSKDAAGDYTVAVPANYYDVFFYPTTGTYVIYFKDTSYEPMYRTQDGLIGLQYAPAITCYTYCGPKGIENMPAATDEKAKVSSNDTTAGYLNGKLVAGSNITFTENNNGGNETLTISASGGGVADKRTYLDEYENATTTYSDIVTVTGLAASTNYIIYIGGYFDPSEGQHNWNFQVCDGAGSGLPYPSYWNGWMTCNRATTLPDGITNVNTMIPGIYSIIQGGYGLTWNSDSGNLVVGISFSYTTGSTANSRTLKWQGKRNGTSVGGSLTGYDLVMIAKAINI
jgi:hypothetical protein